VRGRTVYTTRYCTYFLHACNDLSLREKPLTQFRQTSHSEPPKKGNLPTTQRSPVYTAYIIQVDIYLYISKNPYKQNITTRASKTSRKRHHMNQLETDTDIAPFFLTKWETALVFLQESTVGFLIDTIPALRRAIDGRVGILQIQCKHGTKVNAKGLVN